MNAFSKKMSRTKAGIALFLIGAMLLASFPAFATAGQTSDQQIGTYQEVDPATGVLTGEALGSGETEIVIKDAEGKDAIWMDKTITGTDEENAFDLTLKVTTSENLTELPASADAAVVLVMDVSTSMEKNAPGQRGKSRYDKSVEGAKAFIDAFSQDSVVDGQKIADRYVKIVEFGTNAKTVSGAWRNTAIAEEKTLAKTDVENTEIEFRYLEGYRCNIAGQHTHQNSPGGSAFGNDITECSDCGTGDLPFSAWYYGTCTGHSGPHNPIYRTDSGNTNIEGGLQLAYNLLSDFKTDPDYSDVKSLYVVLLSDGEANRTVSGNRESRELIFGGNSGDSDRKATAVADKIKSSTDLGATLYSIGYVNHSDLLSSFSDVYLNANDNIELQFEKLGQLIAMTAQAWIIEDTLPAYLDFDSEYNARTDTADIYSHPDSVSTTNYRNYNTDTKKLHWNLKNDLSVDTGTSGKYIYSMTYRVRLNPLWKDSSTDPISAIEPDTFYPTNTGASLTYYFVKDVIDPVTGDIIDSEDFHPEIAYFHNPTAKGFFGSLDFTKVAAEDNNKPLSGAIFQLRGTGSRQGVTYTSNTSGADGKISFPKIANGTYELVETQAPTHYVISADKPAVTVSYGKVTFDGAAVTASSNLKVANTLDPRNITIAIQKVWSAPEGLTHPNVTFNLIQREAGESGPTQVVPFVLTSADNLLGTSDVTWRRAIGSWPSVNVETGNTYSYAIEEVTTGLDNYTPGTMYKVDSSDYDLLLGITNTLVNTPLSVNVEKEWVHPEGSAEPAVEVQLKRTTGAMDSQQQVIFENCGDPVTLSEGNWSHEFTNLPRYDGQWQPYTYTVEEILPAELSASYTSQLSGDMEEGFTITNTVNNMNVVVSGTKLWKDGGQESDRPDAVTIHLLRDGEPINSVSADREGGWNYRFDKDKDNKDLPKYNEARDHQYVYTVEEEAVDGYTSTVSGYNVTNTRTGGIKITGEKVWVDTKDASERETITFILKQNTAEIDRIEVTNTESAFDFGTLDRYDDNGDAYEYTVEELPVEGYGTTSSSAPDADGNIHYIFTNKINQDNTVSVSGVKTWIDNDEAEGTRPEKITVILYADGEEKESQDITALDGWSYSFTNLPKYSFVTAPAVPAEPTGSTTDYLYGEGAAEQAREIVYTIEEAAVDNYTTAYDANNPNNIINTIEQDQINVTVNKIWQDPDGTGHDTITIRLWKNGEEIDSAQIPNGETQAVFEGLDKYDLTTGKPYHYTITEDEVAGYNKSVSDAAIDGEGNYTYTVTNAISQSYKPISATKVWVDNRDEKGLRPAEGITIKLYRDDAPDEALSQITVTEGEGWIGTFINPEMGDGTWPVYNPDTHEEYVYSVAEDQVEGYLPPSVNGFVITNVLAQETITIPGVKVWVAPLGSEYPAITVNLLRNGEKVDSQLVESSGSYVEFRFADQPKYDENREPYTYTLEEEKVEGYTSEIENNRITNTIEQASKAIKVTKLWSDGEPGEETAVTIELLKDGSPILDDHQKPLEIQLPVAGAEGADKWTYTFEGLDTYNLENGQPHVYSIVEKNLPASYEEPVITSVEDGFTVTNTLKKFQYQIIRNYKTVNQNGVTQSEDKVTEEPVTISANEMPQDRVITIDGNTEGYLTHNGNTYAYQAGQGNNSVTFGAEPEGILTINLYYERAINTGGGGGGGGGSTYYDLTVNYLEEGTGSVLASAYSTTIQSGYAYDATSQAQKAIEGYVRTSVSGDPLTGYMNGDKVINVYYSAGAEIIDPDTPLGELPTGITDPAVPTGETTGDGEELIIVDGEVPLGNLPQTGTTSDELARPSYIMLLGALLMLAGVFLMTSRRWEERA